MNALATNHRYLGALGDLGTEESYLQEMNGNTQEVLNDPAIVTSTEQNDTPERVLVSGASGYIACHVVKQLLESGKYVVRGTVRNLNNEKKVTPLQNLCTNAKYPLELAEAELLDEHCWERYINYTIRFSFLFLTDSTFIFCHFIFFVVPSQADKITLKNSLPSGGVAERKSVVFITGDIFSGSPSLLSDISMG